MREGQIRVIANQQSGLVNGNPSIQHMGLAKNSQGLDRVCGEGRIEIRMAHEEIRLQGCDVVGSMSKNRSGIIKHKELKKHSQSRK